MYDWICEQSLTWGNVRKLNSRMCKNEVVKWNGNQGVMYLPISMLVKRDLCKNVYEETFDQVWGGWGGERELPI